MPLPQPNLDGHISSLAQERRQRTEALTRARRRSNLPMTVRCHLQGWLIEVTPDGTAD